MVGFAFHAVDALPVSVIVPIYNSEEYLEECLLSIVHQSVRDIEVICVDDHSDDASVEIVERCIGLDQRITLIQHEVNRGPGAARNSGLLAARGHYLLSVDSDDLIAPNMVERLLSKASDSDADVVACGLNLISSDGLTIKRLRIKSAPLNVCDVFAILKSIFFSFNNKLWRRSIFSDNEILFPDLRYAEDFATTARALAKATIIDVVDEPLYVHRWARPRSLSSSPSAGHVFDHMAAFFLVRDFLFREGLWEANRKGFLRALSDSVDYHAERLIGADVSIDKKTEYLRILLTMKCGFLVYGEAICSTDPAKLFESFSYSGSCSLLDQGAVEKDSGNSVGEEYDPKGNFGAWMREE